MSRYYLRRTIGSWSAGTRVNILKEFGVAERELQSNILTVRVLAGNKPVIDVAKDDIVERGRRKDTNP